MSFSKKGSASIQPRKKKSFINDTYAICKSISIDYGIMEKAANVYVLEADFGWSDLGTWGSLYENRDKQENGNSIVGKECDDL